MTTSGGQTRLNLGQFSTVDASESSAGFLDELDRRDHAPFAVALRKHLRDLLQATPGQMVADVGCGTGKVVAELSESGVQAIGVDISEQAISRARRRFPTADFRIASAETLPFADGELRAYVAMLLYQHLKDPAPPWQRRGGCSAPTDALWWRMWRMISGQSIVTIRLSCVECCQRSPTPSQTPGFAAVSGHCWSKQASPRSPWRCTRSWVLPSPRQGPYGRLLPVPGWRPASLQPDRLRYGSRSKYAGTRKVSYSRQSGRSSSALVAYKRCPASCSRDALHGEHTELRDEIRSHIRRTRRKLARQSRHTNRRKRRARSRERLPPMERRLGLVDRRR